MNGIKYICLTTLKNYIKDILKKPAKLITYILAIALIILIVWTSASPHSESSKFRSITELGAIIFGFFAFMFFSQVLTGMESGSSFFGLYDINLLFVSPTSSKLILFYGIIRQATMSILFSVFIFFQSALLKSTYNIDFSGLLVIFFGYILTLVAGQMVAMSVYMFCNGNPKRKRTVKLGLYLLLGAWGLMFLYKYLNGSSLLSGLVFVSNSSILEYTPFIGWLKATIYGILTGDLFKTALFGSFTILGFVGIILTIFKCNIDYYEDVLDATTKIATIKDHAKQGKIMEASSITSKKIKTFGFSKGKGAATIFYKHMIENKRSGFGPFGQMSIISFIAAIVIPLTFMREVPKNYQLLLLLGMLTYLQVFTMAGDRWVKELTFHYIYLIPESPFKKLLSCLAESLLTEGITALFLFIPIGIIIHASPVDIFVCIIARISFQLLFMAGNVLSERLLGSVMNKGLLLFLYFIMMILLAAPGIIGTAILLPIVSTTTTLPLGCCVTVSIAWNIVLSTIIIFSCKNILSEVEFK